MEVKFGQIFEEKRKNFPIADQLKIAEFIYHVNTYGLEGLIGRNKSSDNVPKDDPNWLKKVRYAQQHKLWHYHIGIPSYDTANNGEQVSEYILHYIKDATHIKIVNMSYHPPFELPSEEYLI